MHQKTHEVPHRARVACATGAAALAFGLVLTGCSSEEPKEPTSQESEHAATATPTEPLPTDAYNHDSDHGEDLPERPAELTDEAEARALDRAVDFVEAAAWHDDEWEWWDQVEPFLTEMGINHFNSIDPYNIDYTEVAGDPALADVRAPVLVLIDVPTRWVDEQGTADGPTMRVMLSDRGDDWYVQSWEYAPENETEEG